MIDKLVSVVASAWQDSWTAPAGRGSTRYLTSDGYEVIVVQNPTVTLADDVVVTRRAIASAQDRRSAGRPFHGGVVSTEADIDPKVTSFGYIAAFAPEPAIGRRP